MKHHVCAWYVRTLLYVHVCTDIAQYITAVFITVAIAANEGRHIITMDVETAYLNAKMIDDKPVYMKI